MKRGVPPTARNARTGEFTPPGMTFWARSNSCELFISACASVNVARILRRRCVVGIRLAFAWFAFLCGWQGPEEAVWHDVAHAGPEPGIERLVEKRQRLADRGLQLRARCKQRRECGSESVAGADE